MELREGDVAENQNIRSSRGAAENSLTFEIVLPGGRVQLCLRMLWKGILGYMELREGDVAENQNTRSSRGAAENSWTFEIVLLGGCWVQLTRRPRPIDLATGRGRRSMVVHKKTNFGILLSLTFICMGNTLRSKIMTLKTVFDPSFSLA